MFVILLYSKMVEPLWGTRECIVFYFLITTIVALCTTIVYFIAFTIKSTEEFLFDTEIHGLAGKCHRHIHDGTHYSNTWCKPMSYLFYVCRRDWRLLCCHKTTDARHAPTQLQHCTLETRWSTIFIFSNHTCTVLGQTCGFGLLSNVLVWHLCELDLFEILSGP